jgi:hypothetical protein
LLNGPKIEQLFLPITEMQVVALNEHKLRDGLFGDARIDP